MVVIFTATLLFSCCALALLLSFKHWELSTGRVLCADARVRVNVLSHRATEFVEYRLPAMARMTWHRFLYWLRGSARTALAQALLSLEHALERSLYFLRHGLVPPQDAKSQVSAFLQEVADHKKRLVRNGRHARALQRISE